MGCNRCGGLLIRERSVWVDENLDQIRCVNCSDYTDEEILKNRTRHPLSKKELKRGSFTPRHLRRTFTF